jgi:hypothetical protein
MGQANTILHTRYIVVEQQNIPYSNSGHGMLMTHHNQTKVLTTWFLNHPLDEYIDDKKHKV